MSALTVSIELGDINWEPPVGPRSEQDLFTRLLLRSMDVGPCWVWQGSTNGAGYGVISVNGRGRYIHRAIWEDLRGPIPAGLVIDHLCSVKRCWRPQHLEPVTQRENTLRALREPKTHCDYGHEFTTANSYMTRAGHRQCRACKARREKERRAHLNAIGGIF